MKIRLTDKNNDVEIVDYEEFKESQQLFYNYVVELVISSVELQDVDYDFEFESYSEEIMSAYDYGDEDFEVEEYVSSIYENYIEDIQPLINKYTDIEIIR
ncbi:hypothetical protein NB550_24055 [Vibrio parahaemolyticus]|uniref:hypothetical protein n=1 Tax=Vibrio parahaemolyticus TaxID=670 RepID=UPI00215CCA4B|nr:hypothetical protein [Vibrio parahaemolyticus]EKH9208422.1 hypothetical protein [Vibrio parahaemolyticus]MCR9888966.1 hypothetical protein [Vibrio parahaemolyticus]MCR9920556.1 hypothetical protein [Vibrio parahaemolyticus]